MGVAVRGDVACSQRHLLADVRADFVRPHVVGLVLHEFVSPKQAAERLGVNRETIYRLCARGELPHVRVGSILRVDITGHFAHCSRS
jgi:excisionase family DNA binding protein